MRLSKGSNIVEYVIPLGVIGLVVGLGIFYMMNEGKLLNFAAQSSNMEVNNDIQKGVINPNKESNPLVNPNAGSLGGSLDKPVGQCYEGNCAIDYGDFIITNIPEDFNDFVQTSGTAGSLERMATYLTKVASDLNDSGQFDLANEIQALANLGHNIALIMAEYERIYNLCGGNSTCLASYDNKPFPMPEGFDTTLLQFPANATYKDMIDSGAFGAVINGTATSPLAQAYVDQYNKIMNSGTVQTELKGVIEELSWNIGTVGQDFQSNYSALLGQSVTYYDPVTGNQGSVITSYSTPQDNFSNYDASGITNFYSSMICSTGLGTDSGTTCH